MWVREMECGGSEGSARHRLLKSEEAIPRLNAENQTTRG